MNTEHKKPLNTFLLFIALVVVGVFVWIIWPHPVENTMPPLTTPVIEIPGSPTDQTTLYSNTEYGISLRYNDEFVKSTEAENASRPWRYNSAQPGTRLFTITLPKSVQPQTNFSSVELYLGASATADAVKGCLVAENGEVAAGMEHGFEVFTLGDAGAGNYYETTSYRVMKNGTCVAIESVVHSVNVANYPVEAGITEFDHALIQQKVQAVIDSIAVQ